jgi:hypothetical protein
MGVNEAIATAETILPGGAAADNEQDPRWQAIIDVAEHIETDPEPIWAFALRWGSFADEDLQAAIATCVVEHLLEHHFDRFIGRVEEAVLADTRFAKTVALCWKFRQSETGARSGRFDRLMRLAQSKAR